MLLRLKSVHVHWQLSRSHNAGQKNKFPALKLSAIAQVEIFAEGIVLPASALFNTRAPPKTGGPVKVEKAATPAASGLSGRFFNFNGTAGLWRRTDRKSTRLNSSHTVISY